MLVLYCCSFKYLRRRIFCLVYFMHYFICRYIHHKFLWISKDTDLIFICTELCVQDRVGIIINLIGILYCSILDFSKDCDYTLTMVDNLLDLLTGGEHRKTMRILEERRKLREEEEQIRQLLEGKAISVQLMSDEKIHSLSSLPPDIKVDFGALKALSDVGIDTKFLDVVGEYCLFVFKELSTR